MRNTNFLILISFVCLIFALPSNAADESIKITSKAFTNGSTIPKDFTADGKDVSPPINWSKPPAQTKAMALTCEDPDAPVGTWFHWIVFNIPPKSSSLKENFEKAPKMKNGTVQGSNDFRKIGYNGPSPPKGPKHHYNFKVFALKKKLSLKPGCTKKQFYQAIKGQVLAKGQLTGIYQRKK